MSHCRRPASHTRPRSSRSVSAPSTYKRRLFLALPFLPHSFDMADQSLWTMRKDICDFIAVHPVPDYISKDDFVAKHGAFLDAMAKTEIGKKHFLKLTQYVQTHTVTDRLVKIGMPRTRDIVITHAVYRDAQGCKELLGHSSTKALVEEAKLWGYEDGASLFTVDTLTRTFNPTNLAGNETAIGVFKIPTGVPKQLFEEKVKVLLENAFKIPAIADQLVEYTVWYQGSAVDFEVMQSLAMPAPVSLVVCKAEVQLTSVAALLDRAEVQELLKEHMLKRDLPLGLEGDFFVATKIVRFEKD
ncbi:hypothetical protein C8F01DRAFT_1254490 [Mycena amicta]|nr:hypothetical protein C8F01DRAFT_1254490 [Mycena amicta]